MVAHYTALISMSAPSGIPRDQFENVWHFVGASATATEAEAANILTQLGAFYTSLESYYSSAVAPEVELFVYDADAPKPRPRLFQGVINITSSSSVPMPEQVALCLSFYASINAPRHRGRVYLGPWSANDQTVGPAGDEDSVSSRPKPAFMAAILSAAETLKASPLPTTWCVRSGLGTGTVAAPVPEYEPVQHGWVDNEWDIQRRRGLAAWNRVSF